MDEEKRSNQNYEIIESCTIGSTELETDKDAVLIEKIDDDDNPYFVSEKLLTNISNYKC